MRSVYLPRVKEIFGDTKDALWSYDAYFAKFGDKYRDGWLLTDGSFLDRWGLMINYRPRLTGQANAHDGLAARIVGYDIEKAAEAQVALLNDGHIRMTAHIGSTIQATVRPTRPQYDFLYQLKATDGLYVEPGGEYAKGTEGDVIVDDLKAVFR